MIPFDKMTQAGWNFEAATPRCLSRLLPHHGWKKHLCNTFTSASSINTFSLNQGPECVILKGHQKIESKIPGGISRFALGFCKNKKKRAETLYQSFSPFMSTIQKIENDEGASVDG